MSTPIQPPMISIERNDLNSSLVFAVKRQGDQTITKYYNTFQDVIANHPTAVLPAGAVHSIVEDALRKTGRI